MLCLPLTREVDFCEAKRRRERKRKTTPQSAAADSSPDKGSRQRLTTHLWVAGNRTGLCPKIKIPQLWVILLAENLKNVAKCEHRVCRVKRKWAKPKPLYKQKRARIKGYKAFYSCSVFSFCRYVNFVDSICFHFVQSRYIVASRQFDMR